ncbi:DUF3037 domain-containing protein [Nonomuraea sp. NBC_01738]|uniref:DUF3037 domain-containing protein n=1 Tax=Nonomuraea sp. NBC_01738 TaxID=2976003 RepID=UPI002E117DF9|nr:DUF3037 domain-containing protein [Nonomuraea sp. NBC_01738]
MSRDAYEYAVIRVIPRVERGEQINAGVLLYCQPRAYLCARVALDDTRLLALDPAADLPAVRQALGAYQLTCGASAGPVAAQPLGARFRWLTAPRSTIVQTGPVHAGLTDDPDAELDRLVARLVTV